MNEDEVREKRERQRRRDIGRLNRVVSRAVGAFAPPTEKTVTEWAEHKRVLTSKSSSETGPWRTSRTPYLREPMDAFTDPKVRHIVVWSASQVGKSELINNCIGYVIDEDPSSILFIQPTTIDCRDYSTDRIAPMIEACPSLRDKVADPKSRDSRNTILKKTFPGGVLTMCGSQEAHALASKPIRYVFGDERDRWAKSAGKEGDPWLLAMARQTTFWNAKSVEVSTPTVKGASAIEKAYAQGTMERWKTKCPHCGEYHEIRWEDIRYEHEEKEIKGVRTFKVRSVWYVCPSCGAVSDEADMKSSPARWEADNPDAYEQGTRSFKLNAFVSRWKSWESIVLEFLQAKDDPQKLQVVFNTIFGELWEDRGDLEDEDGMLARRESYGETENGDPVELPEGVLMLTAGVDTQDNRFEYEVVGHGHFGETWGIEKGVIMGKPDDDATWQALDDAVIDRVFRFAGGVGLRVSMTFVDEGGHYTMEVRQGCQQRIDRRVFAVKGVPGPNRPYTEAPKLMKIVINERYLGACYQYQIGVDAGKTKIMAALKVRTPGPRYCHFPARDDYDRAYFTGLLSERLIYDTGKKEPWRWVKIPGHERNEALDCRDYAMAAFNALPKNLDETERRLRAAKEGRTTAVRPAPVPSGPARVRKGAPERRRGRATFDDW